MKLFFPSIRSFPIILVASGLVISSTPTHRRRAISCLTAARGEKRNIFTKIAKNLRSQKKLKWLKVHAAIMN